MVKNSQLLLRLRSCNTLQQLLQIHAQAIARGLLLSHLHLLLSLSRLSPPPPPLLSPYALSLLHSSSPLYLSSPALLRSLASSPTPILALHLLVKLLRHSLPPTPFTFPSALKACSSARSPPHLPLSLHALSLKFGFSRHLPFRNTLISSYSRLGLLSHARRVFDDDDGGARDVVTYNALIAAYAKAGQLADARRRFDEMPDRDAVSWATLVSAYARAGACDCALSLFDEMRAAGESGVGVAPDAVAVVGALSACAQLGALEKGREVHGFAEVSGRAAGNVYVQTGIVDMYAKCGRVKEAMQVFERSLERNVYTWNAMILGFGMNGYGEMGLEYLGRMCEAGLWPDGVTFLGVLVGCSHVGLVESAWRLFNQMESVFGVHQELGHYGCMVDLLSRAGLIETAMEVVKGMPMEGDVYVWGGLLGGCSIHGNVEVAEIAARHIIELDPDGGGTYSIMANIYANAGRWEDVARMRKLMHVRRVKKYAGGSLIHVDGVNHEFVCRERWHARIDEVCRLLDGIARHLLDDNLDLGVLAST